MSKKKKSSMRMGKKTVDGKREKKKQDFKRSNDVSQVEINRYTRKLTVRRVNVLERFF